MFIFSFLTGTIGRWLMLAVVGLGLVAYIRHDAAAPYKNAIEKMREASQKKDEIIRRDAERQLDDMQRQSQLESRLNEILSTSNADSCHLSTDELERLRSLANPSSGKRS